MAGFDRQERGTSGSLVGSLINPITSLKYQFLSGWAWFNYRAIARSGAMSYKPLYLTSLITGGKLGADPSLAGLFSRDAGRNLMGIVSRGVGYDPAAKIGAMFDYKGNDLLQFRSRFSRGLSDFLKTNRWRGVQKGQVIDLLKKYIPEGLVEGKLGTLTGSRADLFSAVSIVKRGQMISRLGSVAAPIIAGITAGNIAANLAGLWFKGTLAAVNFAEATVQHMRNLEMGGDLGPGFRTGAAATERQRAVKELQRTPLAGRRFMGNEANVYSGLI